MVKITPKALSENAIRLIGDDWMLVTAGNIGDFNTMTANWGGMGFLWNKPVVFIFVRPTRHTYGFTEANELMTLSFFDPAKYRRELEICGSKSGRDHDKMALTGLTPEATANGSVTFAEARLVIECRKLYADMIGNENFIDKTIAPQWYASGDFHKLYIAEIIEIRGK